MNSQISSKFRHVHVVAASVKFNNKIMGTYEEDRTHQFLMGLNDDLYSTLQSQILTLDPWPPLDKIFNMTQQEENHKKIMMARDTEAKQPWFSQHESNPE